MSLDKNFTKLSYFSITEMFFLLPDTDLTLTTERLVELFASVSDKDIDDMGGYHLDIPYSKSEEFKMNYQNPAQRKEAYLDYYVHNHPIASWTEIAEALRECKLPQQAAVVEACTHVCLYRCRSICVHVY